MPSLKDIRVILNEAKFNPKEPGPLNIVSHSTGPSYLESRSIEFTMEAQIKRDDLKHLATLITGSILDVNVRDKDQERFQNELNQYKQKMIRAIQCLALAIIKVENGEF